MSMEFDLELIVLKGIVKRKRSTKRLNHTGNLTSIHLHHKSKESIL